MLSIILLGLNFLARRIEKVVLLKMNFSMINDILNHLAKVSLIITNKIDPVALNQRINLDIQTIINFYLGSISQIISNTIIIVTIFILYKSLIPHLYSDKIKILILSE